MIPNSTASKYAELIKDLLVNMAAKDELPLDISQLDTKKIKEILLPIFKTIRVLEADATIASNGGFDLTDTGLFQNQIILINKL